MKWAISMDLWRLTKYLLDLLALHTERMKSPLWIAVFYFGEFVSDDQGKWNWKRGDSHVLDGLEIVTEISYKELYSKLLDLCNVDYSLHELVMRFLLPSDAMFLEPIHITLDKHVHWYVGLNKQGQPRPICITPVSKGLALVNDKTDAVELGELELEIEMETLSFNNVQSQGNDYWQDLEILS
ncbi:Uncharacterized protein Fot_32269 [Forsythia ovata]|uniref:Uncharacterized protein n=1 Tax=Forsythia ovata TaxID=205694 RepID=A0ABD1T7D8_9LAMI